MCLCIPGNVIKTYREHDVLKAVIHFEWTGLV